MEVKNCTKCKKLKEINCQNFTLAAINKNNNKKYFKNKCKECEKLSCKEYHHKNRDHILKRKKESNLSFNLKYNLNNQEMVICDNCNNKMLLSEQNFQSVFSNIGKNNNIKYFRKICNNCDLKIYKQQRKNRDLQNSHNPLFFLKDFLNRLIAKEIKELNFIKNKMCFQYLPFTIENLVNHLQQQFDDNMNWNNFGTFWRILHLTHKNNLPYSSLNDNNFNIYWNLNNLKAERIDGRKFCNQCFQLKELNYFSKSKSKKDTFFGLIQNNQICKNCEKINRKIKRQKNPMKRIRQTISGRINKVLKLTGSCKNGKSISKYLSYTIEDLKNHLESLFYTDYNISWENYGSYWHLDHIIPQSDLPYTSMQDENFKICWSLNNLRPLEAKRNIKEGTSRLRHKKL